MDNDELMALLIAALMRMLEQKWNTSSMNWLAQARAEFHNLVRRIAPQVATNVINEFIYTHRKWFNRLRSKYGFEGLPVEFLFYMELWQEQFVQNMMRAFDTISNTADLVYRGVRGILDGRFQTISELRPPNTMARLRSIIEQLFGPTTPTAPDTQRTKDDETPKPKKPRKRNIKTPILDRLVQNDPVNKKRLKQLKQSKLGGVIVEIAEGLLGLIGFDPTPLKDKVTSIVDAILEDSKFEATTKLTRKVAQELGLNTYRWRTQRDNRVRPTHRALEGTIRTWDQSPLPGEEQNCRCWAELLDN
jgi:SPP1 gp7 family putative phage head morphogenesis protein